MAGVPTFGLIGAGADVLGGVVGAIGASNAGSAAASADIAAGQAENQAYQENAEAAGTTAANTRLSLNRSGVQADYNENKLIGKQSALYGAGGVGAKGSPLDVMGDTESQYRVEAMNRYYQGEEAGQIANQQSTADYQAGQAAIAAGNASASAAESAADTGIFSSILGGLGSAGGVLAKLFPNFTLPL